VQGRTEELLMESLTKRKLEPAEIEALVERAFPGAAVDAAVELTDGWFNAVYAVELADGRETVLKVAPPPGTRVLTYEAELMRTEIEFCERAATAGVPVPELLFHDGSRELIESDYLFLGRLRGRPLETLTEELTDEQIAGLRYEIGHAVAQLHRVTGRRFGYLRAPHPTWRRAFLAMLGDLLADARELATPLPRSCDEIAAVAAATSDALDAVREPRLVHFDLWDANVFVVERDGRFALEGIIDGERAFYGDPLAEAVALAPNLVLDDAPALVAGYEAAGGRFGRDRAAGRRLALYALYLGVVVCTEAPTRGYGPDHAHVLRWGAGLIEDNLAQLETETVAA
jgi:aminoglycoside phosphotransferase (APT) family kinase protein